MNETGGQAAVDRRFMAAAIRLSRRNLGRTGTNPSVGTLIVRDDGEGPVIVGRGVTAIGGRPHAEAEALAEAGGRARGATAYVTLEPCAHHGRTPPCAEALVAAGIARVVGAAVDPDPRVSGDGYAILREGGLEVTPQVLAGEAGDLMRGYLTRSIKNRPEVILKLAISADGMIGRRGAGQVAITGDVARRQVHLLRAECDAILVGTGTAAADDPLLTVRLAGLERRSPTRIVVDPAARLSPQSRLARTAGETQTLLACGLEAPAERREALRACGVGFIATDSINGRVALPEFLEDLANRGFMTLLVEGGAETARHFLEEDLVDRLVLFRSDVTIGADGVAAPLAPDRAPPGFVLKRQDRFGADDCFEYVREG